MKTKPHAIVVGSGPSGVATSYALLQRGFRISILDYGNVPNTDNGTIECYQSNNNRENLIKVRKLKWKGTEKDSELIEQNHDCKSNYFYASSKELLIGHSTSAVTNLSLALGGMSNLWGASVLPPHQIDLIDLPISVSDLQPFYFEIKKYMGISASDEKEIRFLNNAEIHVPSTILF